MEKMLNYKFSNSVPYLWQRGRNQYVTYAFNMSGGCTVKWFRDTPGKRILRKILTAMGAPELRGAAKPDQYGYDTLLCGKRNAIFRQRDAGCNGWDEAQYLAWRPVPCVHGRETYEMKLNIGCLEDIGIHLKRIITVGGGSNRRCGC